MARQRSCVENCYVPRPVSQMRSEKEREKKRRRGEEEKEKEMKGIEVRNDRTDGRS